MIVAMNPNTPRKHIVKFGQDDVEESKKFWFEYKRLTLAKEAELKDNIIKAKGMGDDRVETVTVGTQDKEILSMCVTNWGNFPDEDGNEVPFDIAKLDWIHPKVRSEMVNVIRGDDYTPAKREKAEKN